MKFELTNYRHQKQFSDEELLDDLRKVAAANDNISISIYDANGKFSGATLQDRFGSWSGGLKEAGLGSYRPKKISDDELFKNLEEVWLKLGRQPKYEELKSPLSPFWGSTYQRQFGTWTKALQRFTEVANGEPTEVELNSSTKDTKSISDSEVISSTKGEVVDEAKSAEVELEAPTFVEEGIKHKTKRDINWRTRWQVLNRDYFRCVSCGLSPAIAPGTILHVDHIKPWSKGGETVLDNLQTLCATCNLGKSNVE